VGKQWFAVCNVHGLIFYALSDLLDRPQYHKELYNLRHSQAQNVVERIFGVAKKHILWETNEYPMPTQAKIVSACGVMHNFIQTYDPDEVLEPCEPEAETHSLQKSQGDLGLATLRGQRPAELPSRGRALPEPCGLPTRRSWRREGRFRMHWIAN